MSAAPAPVLNAATVAESYRHCRRIARKRAKNFYYSFLLLDEAQRNAMCAVYAFMRHCDDLSDDPEVTDKRLVRDSIALWRMQLNHALQGQELAANPIWPAFHDTVVRYSIPHRFFHEMIDGITSDLEPKHVETFAELYRYCYQVASVVGLTIIHIFGFHSVKALLLAERCGIAFQLTNIIRDVREDAEMGRIYLPAEDLEKFGVTAADLRSGKEHDAFRNLLRYQATRARGYYAESEPLLGLVNKNSRPSLWALREIYLRLLGKIESSGYAVLSHRIRVSTPAKLTLLLRAWLVRT